MSAVQTDQGQGVFPPNSCSRGNSTPSVRSGSGDIVGVAARRARSLPIRERTAIRTRCRPLLWSITFIGDEALAENRVTVRRWCSRVSNAH